MLLAAQGRTPQTGGTGSPNPSGFWPQTRRFFGKGEGEALSCRGTRSKRPRHRSRSIPSLAHTPVTFAGKESGREKHSGSIASSNKERKSRAVACAWGAGARRGPVWGHRAEPLTSPVLSGQSPHPSPLQPPPFPSEGSASGSGSHLEDLQYFCHLKEGEHSGSALHSSSRPTAPPVPHTHFLPSGSIPQNRRALSG